MLQAALTHSRAYQFKCTPSGSANTKNKNLLYMRLACIDAGEQLVAIRFNHVSF